MFENFVTVLIKFDAGKLFLRSSPLPLRQLCRHLVRESNFPNFLSMLLSCFQEFCFLPIKKLMANFSGQITRCIFAAGL